MERSQLIKILSEMNTALTEAGSVIDYSEVVDEISALLSEKTVTTGQFEVKVSPDSGYEVTIHHEGRGVRLYSRHGLPSSVAMDSPEFRFLAKAIVLKGYRSPSDLMLYVAEAALDGRTQGLDHETLKVWLDWFNRVEW